jgi:hypothetical protein
MQDYNNKIIEFAREHQRRMAFWPAGTFWSACCGNCDEAVEGVIDADPIAAAVRAGMATRTEWTGTASDLLGALAEVAGERVAKSKSCAAGYEAGNWRERKVSSWLWEIVKAPITAPSFHGSAAEKVL